jgi:acetyltransferase
MPRMAPYPAGLERAHTLADGRRVTIRPIRAEDAAAEQAFLERLCAESRRMRFMKFVGAIREPLVHQFTHVDYARTMAFVCEAEGALVGEARYAAVEPGSSCDFGIVIDDAWHKSGIAGLLMLELLAYARTQGFASMEGLVLRENRTMLRFVRALGFEIRPTAEPTVAQVVKPLK